MRNNKKQQNSTASLFTLLFFFLQIPFVIGTLLLQFSKPIIILGSFVLVVIKTLVQTIQALLISVAYSCVSLINRTVQAMYNGLLSALTTFQAWLTLVRDLISIFFLSIRTVLISLPYQQLLITVLFLASVGVIASVTFFGLIHIENQPYPKIVSDYTIQQPIRFYDAHQQLIFEAFTESPTEFISSEDMTNEFTASVVGIVDPTFYQHPGISFDYLLDTAQIVLFHIPRHESKSITQQLAQNSLGEEANSLSSWIEELILTFQLERRYSKDQLLAMYLTITTFGTEVGAQKAASVLFDKPLSQLTAQESVLLASLINSSLSESMSSADFYKKRYDQTVQELSKKHILPQDFKEKYAEVPHIAPRQLHLQSSNLVQLLLFQLTKQLSDISELRQGVELHSSVDLAFQTTIQQVLVAQFETASTTIPQAAVVISDPQTGFITAVTGNSTSIDTLEQLVDVSQAYQLQTDQPLVPIRAISSINSIQEKNMISAEQTQPPIIHQVKANNQVLSTYTSSAIIAIWIDGSSHPTTATDLAQKNIDAIADYIVDKHTTVENSTN